MTVHSTLILNLYKAKVASGELVYDAAQQRAVMALSTLSLQLQTPVKWWQKAPKINGVYLCGPVGRGKSMLMDLFYNNVPIVQKQRLHFHHFIAHVHSQLADLQGQANPLTLIAKKWAKNIKVLCFDEFFVSDIGDAMIMARLFKALFDQGVVLVATSNAKPEQLYSNGLQRARFLPTIDLINDHCHIVSVAGQEDHRFRYGKNNCHYFVNLPNDEFNKLFTKQYPQATKNQSLQVHSRALPYLFKAKNALMIDFMALCSGPRSAHDYMFLAKEFDVLYIANVPKMGVGATGKVIVHGIEDSYQREKQTLDEHYLDDEARRFIALVDEFYDCHKLLVINAQAQIETLYEGKKLSFEYARTQSRIVEMQNW
ncbi:MULTISPECIES: cell division protein ZapE [unclassified Pseudoalteromonas]|uniref:cell division protein ZapE n=1 Tax=unclassified Pseudoalteromonas TaxID=194690 RepID=UPI000730969B|nr:MULTISPECIES: cell division protein ZapE [unclassified Pseudoalteromonas]KTD99291.1 ATPase [Pseudoalteromonas sp. H71]TMN84927.1 cell division protein ZapE [Pseudoalteromonas sp. S410]TMN88504.1 cell division protein ZapE [Pseudoalteromonas sp. S408]TMN96841.1 cell division protein ZapE [Pseudoalteromonas sp. S407]TMN98515.1 cell division protein ZapE [Pseudoalteromonas sp. S409]